MKKNFYYFFYINLLLFIVVGCSHSSNDKILYSWHMDIIEDKNLLSKLKRLDINVLYQDFSSEFLNGNDDSFIKYLYDNNIKVYHLAGDTSWGFKKNEYKIEKEIDKIINYNKNNSYKINGIVLDIETYILDEFDKNEYLYSLKKAYKYANDNDVYVILAIPTWLDKYGINYLKELILMTNDEISIMNYNIKNTTLSIKEEITLAIENNKKVNTIYEINFDNDNYFSSYAAIDDDYQKILNYYNGYNIGIAYHHYDSIFREE